MRDIGVVTTPQHHVVYKGLGVEGRLLCQGGDVPQLLKRRGRGRACAGGGKLVIDCGRSRVDRHRTPRGDLSNVLALVDGASSTAGAKAEFVQKKRLPPRSTDADADAGVRFASFDGDADRVVYFFFDKRSQNSFTLLDGDKIAVLTAQFVAEELAAAGLGDEVRVGIVQTAYANGAAHKCVLASGIDCPYAKTGVKYCHHKAVEYDIGIYYEANGHGTAIFKDAVVERFREARAARGPAAATALDRLLATAQLYNQAADALNEACLTGAWTCAAGAGSTTPALARQK